MNLARKLNGTQKDYALAVWMRANPHIWIPLAFTVGMVLALMGGGGR